MKIYKFANIAARPYPNICDISNPWIFRPDTIVIINVSQTQKPEITDIIKRKGIDYHFFPLKEETTDIGWENVKKAVKVLLHYETTGRHMLVHCDCGNHRSRLVIEAFHYAKMGVHFLDEYKGYDNHLVYDCSSGFLPPLKEIEAVLRNMK